MTRDSWETDERKKVLSLVRAVPAAIAAKDVKAILEVYDTNNPKFCTFEDDPHYLERVDGEGFRKFVGGLAEVDSASIDREDVRVDFLGRAVAVVTGMDVWETKQSSKITKGRSRFTIVLWKKGKWKVIHEHFTRLE